MNFILSYLHQGFSEPSTPVSMARITQSAMKVSEVEPAMKISSSLTPIYSLKSFFASAMPASSP